MPLKYTIIDYTFDPVGLTTVIDEPVGWDGMLMRLKRSKEWHGFFDFFDDSLAPLQFDGKGGNVLRTAYGEMGAEAYVELKIEYGCSDTEALELLYTGKFQFARYNDECADRCFVECGVEATSCIMTFKNRYDQKVDLDSLVPFEACECGDTAAMGGAFNTANGEILITSVTGHGPEDLLCLKVGDEIVVTDSTTGNNGTYTIASFALGESSSTITVNEPLPGSTGFDSFTISGCLFRAELVPYDGLNKKIPLPTKPLRYEDHWGMLLPKTQSNVDNACPPVPYNNPKLYWTVFDWDTILLNELDDTNNLPSFDYETGSDQLLHMLQKTTGILTYNPQSKLQCTENVEVSVRLLGSVRFQVPETVVGGHLIINLIHGTPGNYTIIQLQDVGSVIGLNDVTYDIDINAVHTVAIAPGDSIWLYLGLGNYYTSTAGGGGCPNPFFLDISLTEASLKMIADSFCSGSQANLYLINEVMSRCAEAYTNDCLRVYSDYFGRTDAQPYTSDEDGCGSLTSITNGLKIRSEPATGKIMLGDIEVTPKVTVSMKEVFDAMNALFNIGMGIEDDPNRPGSELIRVEPMNYFYKPDVLMTCNGVANLRREVNVDFLFSIFKVGYEKWETENINGLNDIFGKREYRTTLKIVRNTYDRLCKFIASDYAIEVTRRLYGSTTKDWRYDNDTFLICLRTFGIGIGEAYFDFVAPNQIVIHFYNQEGSFHVGDQVEVLAGTQNGVYDVTAVSISGTDTTLTISQVVVSELNGGILYNRTHTLKEVQQGNVVSSANILYPEYCYNLRISPARNALRHFKTILMSYRKYLDGELKFTNGEGNFLAQLELETFFDCLDEDGLFAENEDISLDDFNTPADHYPLFWPERVKFEYPMSYEDYKAIKANPYGLIEFQCNGDMEQGWIEDLKYSPYKGMAEFILKPKITA